MPTYVQIYKCIRCRHKWIPRKRVRPKKCPKCKNPWETKGRGLGWRKGISTLPKKSDSDYFSAEKTIVKPI